MPNNPRPDSPEPPPIVGAGYAVGQLAQALTTAAEHVDAATRARAQQRVVKWEAVLRGLLDGTLAVGSRTPLAGVPNWVTLQVVTGGFATGELLAAGPLQPHEQAALAQHFPNAPADARRVLNGFYLTDVGLAELQARLQSGHYDVALPEEGALLTVAWLAHNHYPEEARALLETLGPWLGQLRFYPIPTERARPSGPRIQLQTVATTVERLAQVKPNPQILAQKEAVSVWTPLYDRLLALFCETVTGELPSLMCDAEGQWTRDANGRFPVQGGWPCQHYPADWAARATAWLAEYDAQCATPKLCKRPERAKEPLVQASALLRRCVQAPQTLTGREVGRLRQILATYITKHGVPLTPAQQAQRARELAHATAPTFHEIAQALRPRLQTYPGDDGLEDVAPVLEPLSAAEAAQWQLPAGTRIPATLQNKVMRCLKDTVEALVERGWITSGEVLAQVLPQLTAGVRASGFTDPALRRLVAALYAAFRRRRSLLLLNLEKQVQFEELPWVAALEPLRRTDLSAQELAQQTLQEVARLTLSAFPHAIVPNKLLQELTALARTAALDWPLVEEVAADIFMGEFSAKYLAAAHRAAQLLENTLYATYYGILDFGLFRRHNRASPTGAQKRRGELARNHRP